MTESKSISRLRGFRAAMAMEVRSDLTRVSEQRENGDADLLLNKILVIFVIIIVNCSYQQRTQVEDVEERVKQIQEGEYGRREKQCQLCSNQYYPLHQLLRVDFSHLFSFSWEQVFFLQEGLQKQLRFTTSPFYLYNCFNKKKKIIKYFLVLIEKN